MAFINQNLRVVWWATSYAYRGCGEAFAKISFSWEGGGENCWFPLSPSLLLTGVLYIYVLVCACIWCVICSRVYRVIEKRVDRVNR